MKTKVFFLTCLFIGMATVLSSAQDKSNGADQGWGTMSGFVNVFCDGVIIDQLAGEIDYHWVSRGFKNGVPYREIEQLKAELKSSVSDETFRIRRTDKWVLTEEWTWFLESSYNFIGDKGTVYTGKFMLDYSTYTFYIDHVNCH
ncbi:hypothetical protein [Maribellus sediminis]|uniref:hypothetical protein n=1 Tax=Maribellus sediminis TaxID=2696285 RepID=UPI001431247D|nr:hypothetical protein [Maribellus sediminis]